MNKRNKKIRDIIVKLGAIGIVDTMVYSVIKNAKILTFGIFTISSINGCIIENPNFENEKQQVVLAKTLEYDVTTVTGTVVVDHDDVKEDSSECRYNCADEEFDFACKIVFAEAGGESFEGKVAVMETALNSVEAQEFPNTLMEVFCQPYRFSCVMNNDTVCVPDETGFRPVTDSDITDDIREAVKAALDGDRTTEILLREEAKIQGLEDESFWKGGALYYCNMRDITEDEKSSRTPEKVPVSIKIGNHMFYRYWAP